MNVASMHGMSTLQPSVLSTKGEQETLTLGLRPILLIVDDDNDVRILISDLLRTAGAASVLCAAADHIVDRACVMAPCSAPASKLENGAARARPRRRGLPAIAPRDAVDLDRDDTLLLPFEHIWR